jgi:hypothetical protein
MTDRAGRRLAWGVFAMVSGLLAATLVSCLLIALGEDTGRSEAASVTLLACAMFTFPVVGVLVASRHPRNAIGWILLGIGLVWEFSSLSDIYIAYGLTINPGSLARPDLVLALSAGTWVPGVGLIGTFLMLLFPDGKLPSPRWSPLAWLSGLALSITALMILFGPGDFRDVGYPDIENPLGLEVLRPLISNIYFFVLLIPACIIGCAASLVQRFRRSHGIERLQLKWLAAAAGASASLYLVAMIVSIPYDWSGSSDSPWWLGVIQNAALFSFVLVPLAVGRAILRHRLFDIDRIINRTIVYGVVSALLILVYVGGVFGIGSIVRSITDAQSNNLAVAGSTLVVAALFSPFRTRVQAFIDRRFYRYKYDATRTVEEFSIRMRDELEMDSVTGELLEAVTRSLQPSHVSLWVRPPART